MKVKYIGDYSFINGLQLGDLVEVQSDEPGYIIGKTQANKTVVLEYDQYEVLQ